MLQTISIDNYFSRLSQLPIIDVRSPGEFQKGHIPGATNIELFSDEERAAVGTAYKQVSKEKAMELGYKYVTPKLAYFFTRSIEVAPEKEVVVHCWRGGMRSNAFANYLIEQGFRYVYLIEKGYKAYRNYVLNFFEQPFKLQVLGGYTGSGKTQILHALAECNEQVVDLEELANHRGSAFGGIDLPPQPSTEQFENNLHNKLLALDVSKPIWVEDESNGIGKVNIPRPFFRQMRAQIVYFLNMPLKERAKHLVKIYSGLNQDELAIAITKISKRLGFDKAKIALEELQNKNYQVVVEIILFYYDKYYQKGLAKRNPELVQELKVASAECFKNAQYLLKITQDNND